MDSATAGEPRGRAADGRLVGDRYRLLSPLGRGGMGTVWRAEDVVLGREVAVKEVTFPHGLSDEDREVLRERTRREARAAARLDHPSAVTVYDVVEEHGAPYLVMELVDARTLADVVRSDGPLSPRDAAAVGLAVLGALEAAHAQGIVHRDVKPGNVMLQAAEDGTPRRVVLTDFGIAHSPGESSITSTGLLLGSPAYIAPERARGQPPDPASDLWSLGATLFTAVEGRPPYDGGDPLSTVTAVVTGEHEPFVAAGPLAPVLDRLLERDPAARIDSTAARAALAAVAAGRSAPGTAAAAPAEPAPEAERRTERTTAFSVQEVRRELGDERAGRGGAGSAVPVAVPVAGGRAGSGALSGLGTWSAGGPAAGRPGPRPGRAPRRDAAAPCAQGSAAGSGHLAEQPGRGPRRGVAALALAATTLVLAAAGLAGLGLAGSGPLAGQLGPARGVEAGADGRDPGADAPGTGGLADTDADVPADWVRFEDPDHGWSLQHPPDWQVSRRGELRQLRNPETRRTLRVGVEPASGDPLQVWRSRTDALAASLADYRQLRLERTTFRGVEAAELEFTFFDTTTLQVVNRRFTAGDHDYFLYWQVRESAFADSLDEFEAIAATFRVPERAG